MFPAPTAFTSAIPEEQPPAIVENFVATSTVVELSSLIGTNDRVVMRSTGWIVLNRISTDAGNTLMARARLRSWAADAVREVRSRTQLPLATLAAVLGVERRSLYFWMEGRPIAEQHATKLDELMGLVMRLDRGDPNQTAAGLLAAVVPSTSVPAGVDRLARFRADGRLLRARRPLGQVSTLLERGDDTLPAAAVRKR